MTSRGIFSVASKTVLFLNHTRAEYFYTAQLPETDLIYLYEIAFLNQVIIHLISEKNIPVIAGTGVSHSLKRYLRKQMDGTLIYDLNKHGALVLNLDQFDAK